MKNQIKVITFGCRLNIFESEIIKKRLSKANIFNVIVLHTCAITAEAERQAKQQFRKILKENPSTPIIITGCSAQNSADYYKNQNNVLAVLGNKEKLVQKYYDEISENPDKAPFVFVGDVLKNPPEQIEIKTKDELFTFDGKTKAFVQIQQGCNNRCSYCIVPFTRGKNQSFSETSILNQCKNFIKKGYKEIILTGVDISAYGSETKNQSLFNIVKKILDNFPTLQRLRLSSLDPAKSYDQIFGLMKLDSRLMPHFHLSIQAGDDKVLSDMRRRHNRNDIITLCKKIRKANKNTAIGADIIVGFPDESEKEFKNTYNLVKKCKITHLHVFPYSVREGTKAASMKNQIPESIKKERSLKLRELGKKLKYKFIKKQKGKIQNILVENNNNGYTENYIFVKILGKPISSNTIVKAKIIKVDKDLNVIAKLV
ncbi:tRNA (N(6)-L-threonylcarbamoyladenosine(37)-C(2))-methylthiotransferase MtaB [bacterium]|nr:tRNA (N(6)-L-threonylcarbamoyladenosine(37)-C(2))-methylthiotransferase MtaB [bacterium]